jgi:hypothetical protein
MNETPAGVHDKAPGSTIPATEAVGAQRAGAGSMGARRAPLPAYAVALAGLAWYTAQLFRFAHSQESVLDEGAYVYKGLLFATGQYFLYQPYGPWSNHMPLAFLIPGYLQVLFGPGLRTARYTSIFFAVLLLAGVWILARRMGGGWWAAAAVWALAINPALLKTFSTAVSQGLVACMLVWTLVLVLGEKRPPWQIALGSILTGLMIMTRINMLPVLPLLVLYIFWEHGKKVGWVSALAGSLTIAFWHLVYWPDILQIWTRLPKSLTPFLNPWRLPNSYKGSWKPDVTLSERILSLFHSLRFHFAATVGALTSVFLWPRMSAWRTGDKGHRGDKDHRMSDFRSAVFLLALFVTLLAAHMGYALGKDYCVFCLAGYMAFFSVTGILLVVQTFGVWREQIPGWLQGLAMIVVLALSAGIGFGSFEETGEALYNLSIPGWLAGSSGAGPVALGALLVNKFGLGTQALRRLLPISFGLAAGVVCLLAALLAWWVRRQQACRQNGKALSIAPSYGYWALVIFLLAGTLLTPSAVLGGGYNTYDCNGDVIATYEAAGAHLAQNIPPGSLVYWKGSLSTVPLLYVPDIRIFPAQINDGYSFLESGDDLDLMVRFGRWNEALAHQWADQADFILIEERSFKGWLRDLVTSGGFQALEPTPLTVQCRENSQILIFKRSASHQTP